MPTTSATIATTSPMISATRHSRNHRQLSLISRQVMEALPKQEGSVQPNSTPSIMARVRKKDRSVIRKSDGFNREGRSDGLGSSGKPFLDLPPTGGGRHRAGRCLPSIASRCDVPKRTLELKSQVLICRRRSLGVNQTHRNSRKSIADVSIARRYSPVSMHRVSSVQRRGGEALPYFTLEKKSRGLTLLR